MKIGRRIVAFGMATLCITAMAGCSQLPFRNDSYKTDIPAALNSLDLGISDAWADVGLSGFVDTLYVGGTLDLAAQPGGKVSPEFVSKVIEVALAHRSLPTRYFELNFRDARMESVDVVPALTTLGASPGSSGAISMDEAEKIAKDAGR